MLLEREAAAGGSAVLLSTCNRCELYWWGTEDREPDFRALAAERDRGLIQGVVRRDGPAAVRHLFRVTAGFESQVFGEGEIYQQVRRSLELSRSAGAFNQELEFIFSGALTAGRRVRQETPLGRHPASVSGAAVHFAAIHLGGTLVGRRVLVLGAGEAAEGVLRGLTRGTPEHVTVINRDQVRARSLADAWNLTDVRSWEALKAALLEADLVIAATAAPRPVVTADLLADVVAARGTRPLLLIDLCVPRNIAPDAAELAGVTLVDLDGLQAQFCPVGDGRECTGLAAATLAQAELIVEEELARLSATLRARTVGPRLAELHRLGAQLAEEEVARALEALDGLSPEDRQVVRTMAERLVRRVMYPLSQAVREGLPTAERAAT